MSDPARHILTLEEAAARARTLGRVPLGFLSYDVENDEIRLDAATDVSPEEVNVILQKFGMQFTVQA